MVPPVEHQQGVRQGNLAENSTTCSMNLSAGPAIQPDMLRSDLLLPATASGKGSL